MITRDETTRLKGQLLELLAEDAGNAERLLERLDQISSERGISAHAALLLLLTKQPFEEKEAREHWESILAHRHALSLSLGREVPLRVAAFDYFVNVNRRVARPRLVDLELGEDSRDPGSLDPVTGLPRARSFRVATQSELRRAKRYSQRAAVVVFDLDEFAEINARVGRLVGDRILRECAMLLHNKVRDIDIPARLGEDELALLLPETDRNGALLVAERYRAELALHFEKRDAGGRALALTVSAGVASYPEDAKNAEALLECAAKALYRAKASGKNAVQVHEPERRRFLRCDLDPDSFEIEVIGIRDLGGLRPRDVSTDGILFGSPEPIDVGEQIELRLVAGTADSPPLQVRGRVVRLEERAPIEGPVPDPDAPEALRFEIGVAFVPGSGDRQSLLEFLERARSGRSRGCA